MTIFYGGLSNGDNTRASISQLAAGIKMVDWTPDRIAALKLDELKNLHENARRRGVSQIVDLCEAELASRRPQRIKTARTGTQAKRRDRSAVQGFHFVCVKERGVTRNADGTVWTGTWVVDESHAETAVRIGAYLALHESKAEISYLQGIIRGWRKAERESRYAEDRPARTRHGVDFLVELTNNPMRWRGDGAGEKGYYYGEDA